MPKVNLHEFRYKTLWEKLRAAGDFLRQHPGSTLVIDPGEYVLTTDRARATQNSVMNGEFGKVPQLVMFQPDFEYDRGLDLDGVKGCRIEAYGAVFTVDGFMEPVSVRNCKNVTVLGLTIDHKRKPYSRGTVIGAKDGKITVRFGENYPITPKMPHMRACLCDREFTRLERSVELDSMELVNEHEAVFNARFVPEDAAGREIYIWHTYHSRPAILIENAENTCLKDVTVHSQPGMGITAHDAKDILFERLRVVPADGECMSTNTDATHLASCRGKVKYDGCLFVGQGDDGLNVHTYYHTVLSSDGNNITCKAFPPDGTHTQTPDYFKAGDCLVKVSADTLAKVDTFRAVSVETDGGENAVVLDHPFGETEGYFIADKDAVPDLQVVNCTMKDHLARGMLIKCPKARIENCTVERTFEYAVKIAPEASWKEGIATDEITVRGCRFTDCDRVNNLCGGIYMYSESADRSEKIHGKITVENCRIECPHAENAMILNNVREITESENTLICNEKQA